MRHIGIKISDPSKLQEVRDKLESLGVKSDDPWNATSIELAAEIEVTCIDIWKRGHYSIFCNLDPSEPTYSQEEFMKFTKRDLV